MTKVDITTVEGSYTEEIPFYANQIIKQNLILNSDSTYELNKYAPPIPTVSKGTWTIKDSLLLLTPFDKYLPEDERDSSYIDSLRRTIRSTVNPEDSTNFKRGIVPRRNNSMYVVSIKAYGDFIYKTDSICYNNGIYSKGCFIKEKR